MNPIKTIRRRSRDWAYRLMCRSPLLATLAYTRNRDFQLEAWAYVNGLVRARCEQLDAVGWRYRLRTNTHILEKGIGAKHRRSVFGASLVTSMVKDLVALENAISCHSDQDDHLLHGWSSDVLTVYFGVVGSDPRIDAARREFDARPSAQGRETNVGPYLRDVPSANACSYTQLLHLSRQRRSVRTFLETPAPRSLVDQAVEVAALSPSACNRQPFHYRFIDDQSLIEQLRDIPGGITCFSNIPMLLVLTGDMRGCVESIVNRHAIYVDASLSVMSFQLALETLGLSSCCVNWSETREKDRRVRSLLGTPPHERVVMFMVIGSPDYSGMVAYSSKKSLEKLRSYNSFGPVD